MRAIFPYRVKIIGLSIFIIAFIILATIAISQPTYFLMTIHTRVCLFQVLVILGALLVLFAREKHENGYIRRIRGEAFRIAIIFVMVEFFIYSMLLVFIEYTENPFGSIHHVAIVYFLVFEYKKWWARQKKMIE